MIGSHAHVTTSIHIHANHIVQIFDGTKCDWILENGSKSHIFISVYLSLQHEKYCIPNSIS